MSIEQFIENEVRSNGRRALHERNTAIPQCGFSSQLVQILEYVGVAYKALNVYDLGPNCGMASRSTPNLSRRSRNSTSRANSSADADIVREMFPGR